MNPDHNELSKVETLALVRALTIATPFEPFEVVTTSGRAFPVPRADFVHISPIGHRISIDGPGVQFTLVHASQISHVEIIKAQRKHKKTA